MRSTAIERLKDDEVLDYITKVLRSQGWCVDPAHQRTAQHLIGIKDTVRLTSPNKLYNIDLYSPVKIVFIKEVSSEEALLTIAKYAFMEWWIEQPMEEYITYSILERML